MCSLRDPAGASPSILACWHLLLTGSVSFFFSDSSTTEIYTLSLHDALPILTRPCWAPGIACPARPMSSTASSRSEEHTSELQSLTNLVCRLLLEKKKNIIF